MTLAEIERLTKDYAEGREALGDLVRAVEDEMAEVKRRYLARIKRTVAGVAERQARLKAAIEEDPELFTKPRTVVYYGVKVGLQKGKGELTWESAEQVCRLIHRHFPEQADSLIRMTEAPVKSALAQMSAAELRRIGVTVIETGDQVVIRSTDSEIDRLVSALLKDEEMEEAGRAA